MSDYQDTDTNAENKGGGYRGGPKRWSGRGPKPARHIPWPEIFKHHISLIEGHQKMIDMVRKHTVEGSGNHRQICAMLDSCKAMLHEAKSVSRTFVPPANHREKVPLGSSSASMYPGYSPADHVYGQAAMEYGSAAARAKAEGVELKPEVDIEYEIGQGKGIKRKRLAEMRAQDGSGSASGSGTDVADGKKVKVVAEDANGEAQPAFYIDTNPTPVDLPFGQKKTDKRASPELEATEEKTLKKAKKAHEGEIPAAPPAGKLETEDISAEVDARMKEKEEKRRKKEEKKRKKEADKAAEETGTDDKKRKREAEGSSAVLVDAAGEVGEEKKPKKKKSKKEKGEVKDAEADGTEMKGEVNGGEGNEESKKRSREEGDAEGKKKKKRKKGEDI
ncbi:hypothetical protein G7Y79_00027g061240 [Physcia stellaris]|nr:hypothetical protein G7Y79_00027g061240 [Physcia stellaris]